MAIADRVELLGDLEALALRVVPGRVMMLGGPPRGGKSAVVSEFARRALGQGGVAYLDCLRDPKEAHGFLGYLRAQLRPRPFQRFEHAKQRHDASASVQVSENTVGGNVSVSVDLSDTEMWRQDRVRQLLEAFTRDLVQLSSSNVRTI